MLSILWVAVDPAPDKSDAQQWLAARLGRPICRKRKRTQGKQLARGHGVDGAPALANAQRVLAWVRGPPPPLWQLAIRGAGPRPSISRPSGAEWARLVAQSQLRGWGEACDQWRGAGTPAAQGPPPIGCLRYHVLGAGLRIGPSRQRGWPHACSGGPKRGAGPSGERRGARRLGGAPR